MGPVTKETIRQIEALPLFQDVPSRQMERILQRSQVERLPSGTVICHEKTYHDELFVLLSGEVTITKNAEKGLLHLGEVRAGDFFGEVAALSGQAGSATVTAATDVVLLKIHHRALERLLNASAKAHRLIEGAYQRRAIHAELKSVPLFVHLGLEVIDTLIQRAEVRSYPKEAVIVRQGEEGDAFYLIRSGFVKVSQSRPNQNDLILAYLREGQYFGEMALVKQERRMATVSAITPVDVIRIDKPLFEQLLTEYPEFSDYIQQVVVQREEQNVALAQDTEKQETLAFVVEEGLVQATTALVIDMNRCIDCDNCTRACAAWHNGHSLLIRKGPLLRATLFPTSCHHCADPACLLGCNFKSMKRLPSGEIVIDKETCTGCGVCAQRCPYDTIVMIPRQSDHHPQRWWKRIWQRLGDRPVPPDLAAIDPSVLEPGEEKQSQMPILSFSADQPNPYFSPTPSLQPKPTRILPWLAEQCDLCKDCAFMACIYNCPTGAIIRTRPTDYFADALETVG